MYVIIEYLSFLVVTWSYTDVPSNSNTMKY